MMAENTVSFRRPLAAAAVGLLIVTLAACSGLGESSAGDVHRGPAASGAGAIELVMKDEVFQPDVLKVPANTPVTLEIRNAGKENHNFTIPELDVSTGPMNPGDVVTVEFTAPAGTTDFTCTWHEASGMVGRLEAQ